MIFWLSGVRDQLSGRRRQCVELRDDEELAQFESSQHGTASKVGDVVLVPTSDSLDDAMDAQTFYVSRYLVGRCTGKLLREVGLSEAGDDVLSSHDGQ